MKLLMLGFTYKYNSPQTGQKLFWASLLSMCNALLLLIPVDDGLKIPFKHITSETQIHWESAIKLFCPARPL